MDGIAVTKTPKATQVQCLLAFGTSSSTALYSRLFLDCCLLQLALAVQGKRAAASCKVLVSQLFSANHCLDKMAIAEFCRLSMRCQRATRKRAWLSGRGRPEGKHN